MNASRSVRVFAPAKINLALHVTGQRTDGYHLLDTLVAFAEVGDWITLQSPGDMTLTVTGPEADPMLEGSDNIVWRVASRFWPPGRPLALAIEKHLPIASGIGGGSADAAACFRGLRALRAADEGTEQPTEIDAEDARHLTKIGADVPMCVLCEPARVRGIGERIEPVSGLPVLSAVLVNPRVHVATPAIFKSLAIKDNPALAAWPERFTGAEDLIAWLHAQRNDLEPVAVAALPRIADVLEALRGARGCGLARMSGSGATCFGLFPDAGVAQAAAQAIRSAHPGWWVQATRLNAAPDVAPRIVA